MIRDLGLFLVFALLTAQQTVTRGSMLQWEWSETGKVGWWELGVDGKWQPMDFVQRSATTFTYSLPALPPGPRKLQVRGCYAHPCAGEPSEEILVMVAEHDATAPAPTADPDPKRDPKPDPTPDPTDPATVVYTLEWGSTVTKLVGTKALKAHVAKLPGDRFRGNRLLWGTNRRDFESTDELKAFVLKLDSPVPDPAKPRSPVNGVGPN